MRLVGYCRGCRKMRYVQVSGHDLVRPGVKQGICAECERDPARRGR